MFRRVAMVTVPRNITTYPASSFPASFPYSDDQLQPYDSSSDLAFYAQPRFVNHIDDHAIEALAAYYEENLPREQGGMAPRILDLCSSWVSHIPPRSDGSSLRVTGVGMNSAELRGNPILERWLVHDLNTEPNLRSHIALAQHGKAKQPPTTLGSSDQFDAVICNVSIDYLIRPLDVMEGLAGMMIPGAFAHMAISNRCFPTKVRGSHT